MPIKQEGPRGFEMDDPSPAPTGAELPAPNFATFVLSLSTSVLMNLGAIPNPDTGQTLEADLPLAKHTIDLLEMLEQKTRGNLDPEEAKLLEGVLHDLHMRFVERTRQVT